jgi:3'(2'), 5'-bisphosphate nucleotidase
MLMATKDDAHLAGEIAAEAGELLVELRSGVRPGRALAAAGDAGSNRLLLESLAQQRPQDVVLSEESADDLSRLTARRVWIVDPLDGSREYGEVPRSDWAVHVALWEDGDLVAGAVSLPALGVVHGTAIPASAADRAPGPFRIAVSRSRPPKLVDKLAADLGAELVPMGSAGVKATAVLRGEVDAYVHAGGQYEWDSAAPVAVCAAAGLHTSRIDGRPLVYNRPDPRLPDLLVCRRSDVGRLLEALAVVREAL